MADTGNTSTFAFTTSAFTASWENIEGPEQTIEKLEDTHIGITGERTYVPGDMIEPGELTILFYWDQSFSTFPPLNGVVDTATLTFPLKSGEMSAATLSGTGFVTRMKGPVVNNNELMKGEITFAFDGKTGPTYTAGS